MKPPSDLDTICDDLKVCGKRELYNLLKVRHKYQTIMKKEAVDLRRVERKARLEAEGPREEEDEDAKLDRELEQTIKRIEHDKKKHEKKERVLAAKSELRKKMSVIATSMDVDNDEDIYLNANQWADMREKVERAERSGSDDDDDKEELEKIDEEDSDAENDEDAEKGSDSESVDSAAARIDEMADEFEDQIAQQNEYA